MSASRGPHDHSPPQLRISNYPEVFGKDYPTTPSDWYGEGASPGLASKH